MHQWSPRARLQMHYRESTEEPEETGDESHLRSIRASFRIGACFVLFKECGESERETELTELKQKTRDDHTRVRIITTSFLSIHGRHSTVSPLSQIYHLWSMMGYLCTKRKHLSDYYYGWNQRTVMSFVLTCIKNSLHHCLHPPRSNSSSWAGQCPSIFQASIFSSVSSWYSSVRCWPYNSQTCFMLGTHVEMLIPFLGLLMDEFF